MRDSGTEEYDRSQAAGDRERCDLLAHDLRALDDPAPRAR